VTAAPIAKMQSLRNIPVWNMSSTTESRALACWHPRAPRLEFAELQGRANFEIGQPFLVMLSVTNDRVHPAKAEMEIHFPPIGILQGPR